MADGADAPVATGAPTAVARVSLQSDYARKHLSDALALSDYAVSTGVKPPSGRSFSLKDIGTIQDTAAKLGVLATATADRDGPSSSVTSAEWFEFEQAYYRLAACMSPVTAETLAATQATTPDPESGSTLRDRIFGYSPALRFTRWFALVGISFGAFVVLAECRLFVLGLDADTSISSWERNFLQSLIPWAYGALGSCAYLLRSAHAYIYQRTFDLRRKPEYFNRVLLGAISGGAIILFVNYLVDEDGGTVLHLSSAALGFVAGYSTDFLFNTIERIVAAVFPKNESEPKPPLKGGERPSAETQSAASDVPDNSGDGDQAGADSEKQAKGAKPQRKRSKAGGGQADAAEAEG